MVQLIIPTSTFASLRPHCPSLPQSAPPCPKSARPRSLLLVIDLYQFNKDVRIEDWGYRGCGRAGRVCGWGLGLRVWGCGWSCLIGMRVLFKYRFVTANHASICLVSQMALQPIMRCLVFAFINHWPFTSIRALNKIMGIPPSRLRIKLSSQSLKKWSLSAVISIYPA